jgi:hypothetical protein
MVPRWKENEIKLFIRDGMDRIDRMDREVTNAEHRIAFPSCTDYGASKSSVVVGRDLIVGLMNELVI